MRTVLYTRCVDTRLSSNNPFPPQKSKYYYCPTLFESYRTYNILSGEKVMICFEDGDILHSYNGECCCGGCVSEWSSTMFTIQVTNTNPVQPVIMPAQSLLVTLLNHADIDIKQTVSQMSQIYCSKYDQELCAEDIRAFASPAVSCHSSPLLSQEDYLPVSFENDFENKLQISESLPINIKKKTVQWNDLCYQN